MLILGKQAGPNVTCRVVVFHNTAVAERYLTSTSPLCASDMVMFMRFNNLNFYEEMVAVLKGKGHLDTEHHGTCTWL